MSHTIFGGVDVSTSPLRTASGGLVRTSRGSIVQIGGGRDRGDRNGEVDTSTPPNIVCDT